MKRYIALAIVFIFGGAAQKAIAGNWTADNVEIKNITSALGGTFVYVAQGIFTACDKNVGSNRYFGVLYVPNDAMVANLMWPREAGKYVQLHVSTDYGATYDLTWRATTTCLLGYAEIIP